MHTTSIPVLSHHHIDHHKGDDVIMSVLKSTLKMSAECINFWEKSLLDVSTRTRQANSTVFIVGNKGVGKSTLVADFCEDIPNRPNNELICYDYFNTNDTDDSESASKINLWSFDDTTFPTLVDVFLKEPSDDKKV